jgi:thiamine pyrophosphate-dependent acetolactate synthase large subunit-like protein
MPALVNQPIGRDQAKVMNRFDVTRRLISLLHNHEAVVGGIGYTNFDLWAASALPDGGRRQPNFYMLGSMGLAIPIALGVALAQPERRVFALEGDGSVLMQLGSLATVAARQVRNLCIVIMDNGTYQITGGQETAAGQGADIVGIARASGLVQSAWATDEDGFGELVGQALSEDGPWLIGCRIDGGKPVDTTERDPARIRDGFMRGLGVRR